MTDLQKHKLRQYEHAESDSVSVYWIQIKSSLKIIYLDSSRPDQLCVKFML